MKQTNRLHKNFPPLSLWEPATIVHQQILFIAEVIKLIALNKYEMKESTESTDGETMEAVFNTSCWPSLFSDVFDKCKDYGRFWHACWLSPVRERKQNEVCLVLDGRVKTGNGSGETDVVPQWSAPVPEPQAWTSTRPQCSSPCWKRGMKGVQGLNQSEWD